MLFRYASLCQPSQVLWETRPGGHLEARRQLGDRQRQEPHGVDGEEGQLPHFAHNRAKALRQLPRRGEALQPEPMRPGPQDKPGRLRSLAPPPWRSFAGQPPTLLPRPKERRCLPPSLLPLSPGGSSGEPREHEKLCLPRVNESLEQSVGRAELDWLLSARARGGGT